MGSVILPQRFVQQPQQVAPLDQSNQFVKGAIVFPLAVAPLSFGAVAGVPTQLFGGTAAVAGARGLALATSAAASDYIKLGAIPQMGTANFTALIVVKLASINASTIFESGSTLTGTGSSNGSFQLRSLSDGSLSVVRDNQAGIGTTPAGLVSSGKYFTAAVAFGGGSMRIAVDGNYVYQVGSGDTFVSGNFSLLSKDGTTLEKSAGEAALFVYWPRALSAAELATITENPWQIFKAPSRRLFASVGGASNTQVTPTVGAVSFAGYAPVLAQTASVTVTPGVSSVAFSGYSPSVARTQNQALMPAVGSVAFTGYSPTVAQIPVGVISPSTGGLAISGYAPTVLRTASLSLSVPAGALSITSYAPMIIQSVPILTIRYRIIEAKQDYNTDTVHFK